MFRLWQAFAITNGLLMKMEDTVAKRAAECATFENKDGFRTINWHYMTQKYKI